MSFLDAVIPGSHRLFTTAADRDFLTDGPSDALLVVGIRVDDITSGTDLDLTLGDSHVVYQNLAAGETLTGTFQGLVAATSDVDTIQVFYR